MGRPRIHDDQTAEALLDAAEAIVAENGAEAVSVRRVAERAGVTTRAVYSVFQSKEGMIVALGNRAFEMLGSFVGEIKPTSDPLADMVEATVHKFRRWALDHPALFRIAFEHTGVSPELSARFRPTQLKALDSLVELVSRAMGLDGGLADREVRETTIKIDAMCEGLALLELRGALAPDRAEQVWRDALTALAAGMRPTAGAHAARTSDPRGAIGSSLADPPSARARVAGR